MITLVELAQDDRTARMLLSMLVEPNDPLTGQVLGRAGAVETLGLIEGDSAVPGLSRVDARVWRDHLAVRQVRLDELATRLSSAQQNGFGVLVPGDDGWPVAVNDLGDRAPYVLWTRGAASFLSRPVTEQ